jgi:hypothetical protein
MPFSKYSPKQKKLAAVAKPRTINSTKSAEVLDLGVSNMVLS